MFLHSNAGASLAYFFAVAWREIVGGMFPAMRCAGLLERRGGESGGDEEEKVQNIADFEMVQNDAMRSKSHSAAQKTLMSLAEQKDLQETKKKLGYEVRANSHRRVSAAPGLTRARARALSAQNRELEREIADREAEIANEKKKVARGRLKLAGKAVLATQKVGHLMG